MVPQIATDLLFLGTLSQELHESDTFSGEPSGTTGRIFESLVGRIDPRIHPRDLSTGQQLSLVLAMQLTKSAPILLLDEPTRGLDHAAKKQLAMTLSRLRDSGKAILITSHDLAFVKLVADRILEIKDRDLVKVIS
jgi:energy-coupling factor transport system ATP-binding protein